MEAGFRISSCPAPSLLRLRPLLGCDRNTGDLENGCGEGSLGRSGVMAGPGAVGFTGRGGVEGVGGDSAAWNMSSSSSSSPPGISLE